MVDVDGIKKTVRVDWFVVAMALIGAGGGTAVTQATMSQTEAEYRSAISAQQAQQDTEIRYLNARMDRYELRIDRQLDEIKGILRDVQKTLSDQG